VGSTTVIRRQQDKGGLRGEEMRRARGGLMTPPSPRHEQPSSPFAVASFMYRIARVSYQQTHLEKLTRLTRRRLTTGYEEVGCKGIKLPST